MLPFIIEKGATVKDKVTGVQGIVVWRTDYLTGCNRYGVQPKAGADGKLLDAFSVDEMALEVLKTPVLKLTPDPRATVGAG